MGLMFSRVSQTGDLGIATSRPKEVTFIPTLVMDRIGVDLERKESLIFQGLCLQASVLTLAPLQTNGMTVTASTLLTT